MLDAVEPSVVSVDTVIESGRGPFQSQGQGAGTGVVFDASAGYIITNAHVVDGATSITVTVGSGPARDAQLVAADTNADIAVLRVTDTTGLVAAKLGSSASVSVGDPVVAIGNALALEGGMTVTQGIVSALNRSLEFSSGTLTGLDPDRRGDQLGQLGWSPRQQRRPGDRNQYCGRRELRRHQRVEHRICNLDRRRDRQGRCPDRRAVMCGP